MKMKKEKTEKKPGVRLPSTFEKIVFLLMMGQAVKQGVGAEEILNAKIVEVYDVPGGEYIFTKIGVDVNDDGIADYWPYIMHLKELPITLRAAARAKTAKTISFDDHRKRWITDLQAYEIEPGRILELDGISVLTLFPGNGIYFRDERDRQERLAAEAAAGKTTPPRPQTAEERKIAELEAELNRLKGSR